MTTVEQAREAFARRAWRESHALLTAADDEAALAAEDLERLAVSRELLGRDDPDTAWERAHHAYAEAGDLERASRAAFWLGFHLMHRGEPARAGGWFARAGQILDDHQLDCVERGYLAIPLALQTLMQGDPAGAIPIFEEAAVIGKRFNEPDVLALSSLGRGQALIALGKIGEGAALHDEAMVTVSASDVSPSVAGIVYCAGIKACQERFDVARAREWTAALTKWCESQPELVPFRGQCLVHRAEVMQLRGAWSDALTETERACGWLTEPMQPAAGMAFYQLGQLQRLRGETTAAEESYRRASDLGHSPQPGLALLRLQQGDVDAARAALRRMLDETSQPIARARVLPANIEILIAARDLGAARIAADELTAIAGMLGIPFIDALAAHAQGEVSAAEGDARGALAMLRKASAGWLDMDAAYELARSRVLIGHACEALGDHDTATMELDAARRMFETLGAKPDLARLGGAPAEAGGLTARELEVLRLVATGKTNRAIARELVISEKTVARHVSNIFTKLGLPSRSAATAYAYEHDLV